MGFNQESLNSSACQYFVKWIPLNTQSNYRNHASLHPLDFFLFLRSFACVIFKTHPRAKRARIEQQPDKDNSSLFYCGFFTKILLESISKQRRATREDLGDFVIQHFCFISCRVIEPSTKLFTTQRVFFFPQETQKIIMKSSFSLSGHYSTVQA